MFDTTVVATSKPQVVSERNGKSDKVENEMMEAMMSRSKWSHVEDAFLSLFYWEKFEKGCYLLILNFSLELLCVTCITPLVTLHITTHLTPNSPCF